ncbi:hypothetical protein [Roseovarius aestuariivivens]|uniref:hypothetical protein n=1 Tax=Roseovarius aestuariivivens TaxID=1888910 RepID=UPI001081B0BE|nr:hypothetical protein [Roseovarius aestuariivivens]
MSAPDTNTQTELHRHKPVISMLRAVMAFAAVLFLGLIIWTFAKGQEPRDAAVKIDGRTGAEVVVE